METFLVVAFIVFVSILLQEVLPYLLIFVILLFVFDPSHAKTDLMQARHQIATTLQQFAHSIDTTSSK